MIEKEGSRQCASEQETERGHARAGESKMRMKTKRGPHEQVVLFTAQSDSIHNSAPLNSGNHRPHGSGAVLRAEGAGRNVGGGAKGEGAAKPQPKGRHPQGEGRGDGGATQTNPSGGGGQTGEPTRHGLIAMEKTKNQTYIKNKKRYKNQKLKIYAT